MQQQKGTKATTQSFQFFSEFQLKYEPCDSQGQCLLISITPVFIHTTSHLLYIIVSVITLGIPLLLTYWYPILKRVIYFRPCPLDQATHFHVINYDNVSTYPQKQIQTFYFDQVNAREVIVFKNRYLTYIVMDYLVKSASFNYVKRLNDILNHPNPQKKSYTTEKDAVNMISSYGPGVMIIVMPSIPMLFLQQVMRPLYMFIIFSCGLWMYQAYYYYSTVIIVTGFVGIATNLYQTYQNNKRIYEMAYHQQTMNAMRNGQIIQISSADLAPGDIVFLKSQIKIPFDGIVLEGDALINQCALTGESVPVLKKPQKIQQKSDIKTSYIYEGTSLIQVGNKKKMVKFEHYRQQYGIPVMVARTNFSTMKGQLIRIISFPKQRQNIFQRQSAKFLIFLFCLSVISYIILIVKLSKYTDAGTLVLKFFDLITITVPPGLPVSMTFGIIFALQKMVAKKIYCSSPNKVVVGGMTNWICFDKTGTLTQDFMDFNFLVLCKNKKFGHPINNTVPAANIQTEISAENANPKQTGGELLKNKALTEIIANNKDIFSALNNMAMNHTIVSVEQTSQNVGDPMEIKLFQFGNFYFSNENNENAQIIMSFDSDRGHKGSVYKRFDFDSQLFRMSTIGKSSVTGDDFYLYTKGSPELMVQIFKKQTIPSDYQNVLKQYTSQGYRVLSIGSRKVERNQFSLSRHELEADIVFQGFEVFENRLKPQTKAAIAELRDSQLPCVMITGDNALTGSNMACQCRISDPNKKTLICNYNIQRKQLTFQQFIYKPKQGQIIQKITQRKFVQANLADQIPTQQPKQLKNLKVDNQQHQTQNVFAQKDLNLIISKLKSQDIQLCISGEALDRVFDIDSQYLSTTESYILMRTTVFARAKPNSKIKAIALYQKLGKKVAMCGDGANDCGALKQADIGLSLSMAEASISAPFTSQITNISSMIELIKQCRAGLATNFSLFNIMAMYSLIQYTTTIITQFYFSYPADFEYLFWDIFCNFVFFLTVGYTKTADKLSKQIPSSSLFTISNLFQVMLAFGLQVTGQILVMVGLTQIFNEGLHYNPQDTKNQFDNRGQQFVLSSPQTNALFLFSSIMYIMTLLAFSISKPWRKQFFTNPLFMLALFIILTYSIVMIVVPGSRLYIFQCFHMYYQPMNWYIFGLAIGFGIFIYIVQKFILEPMFNWLKVKYPENKWI